MKATGQRHSLAAADGVGLILYAYGPETAERAAIVLHGIQSHAGWFTASCEALANAGLRVICPDRRGSGASGGKRGHTASPDVLLDDLGRIVSWVRAERPGRPLQAVAHSWGAVYALAYQGREPSAFERLSLVSPGLLPRVDLSPTQKAAVALGSLISPERVLPIPISGPEAFTANQAKRDAIGADEARLKYATLRFFSSAWRLRRRASAAARRTEAPMTVFLAGTDTIIDTEATRRFFYGCGEGVRVETFDTAHHTLEFEDDPAAFLDSLVLWCVAPPGREVSL
ncbi:MAG: alpha/beta fold hydrolase [Nitrospinae bacterium]|nr:alpha/beta fold hydrolase [Nitrospinota bacterium]